ncbi:ras-related protein Rab-33A isoform X1 [Phaenicophaeus curvirostris]|uniref:ras-related protein Rab-33A isoform X1 n=1 Tax=Phaenicophaeus curvirostris TaxID=33595 RepID=UPI0037F0A8B9
MFSSPQIISVASSGLTPTAPCPSCAEDSRTGHRAPVCENFTGLPRLLRDDGQWLSNFIHQFPQDPRMHLFRSHGLVPCQVQVWDTAGQERFRKSMVEHYYRNVHAVVFVYDVTKMTSFTNLKMWIEECNGHAVPPLVPRVLVGNKCDLKDLIQVPSSMALKFADAHNMLLFETSAKDPQESQNVDAIFMCLACRLKAQRSLLCRDLEGRPGQPRRLEPAHNTPVKSSCPC